MKKFGKPPLGRSGFPQEDKIPMTIQDLERPITGEPLLAPASQRVRSRLGNFLLASGLVNLPPHEMDGVLATGFIPILEAEVGVAATSCERPLVLEECAALAGILALDSLLMRFDALRGVSFDIRFKGDERWLDPYVAWRRPGMDIWLIPTSDCGPFLHIDGRGLERRDEPPFCNAHDRDVGIIRAIAHPLFKGER